ncbi:cysteine hydrolase family protein [Marinomonas sp. RSW2]|uniref:Cysteine hydrolase family protein n=1 Tax=Marinomonas maritima TaxID=2940935 RepID=A0ABT5WFK5_9GAMM|nr:cysteine hydrolase family protein [Marinomonas maritima]MDE8603592.1 cysteine hydrolase family protein [Marinomonas maritima]
MKRTALLVIDPQNDYFEDGLFPLWNTQEILDNILKVITLAQANDMPIIFIQHVADTSQGMSPFFNPGTMGVEIHPQILALAPNATVVVKHFADAFEQTELNAVLSSLKVERLLLCGMMTQNCVTHTAISKAAEECDVKVIGEACTTREEMLHLIALNAISNRVPCVSIKASF